MHGSETRSTRRQTHSVHPAGSEPVHARTPHPGRYPHRSGRTSHVRSPMRYLITGGAGFIGSHLTDALVERGDSVTVLDNLSTGRITNIEHLIHDRVGPVRFVEGTCLDHHLVTGLASEVDVIVHLAASVGVQLIVSKPLEAMLNNVRGTEIVLDAAARFGRRVLVA